MFRQRMKPDFRKRYGIVRQAVIYGWGDSILGFGGWGILGNLSPVTGNVICNQPALTKGLCSYRMEDAGLEPPFRYEAIR